MCILVRMKPCLLLLFLLLGTASFAQKKRSMFDLLPQSYEQLFDFMFRLDSLGYSEADITFFSESYGREEKLRATFKQVSDSTFVIKMGSDKLVLNTRSGKVWGTEEDYSIYQNLRFRIADYKNVFDVGTDELGMYKAYYAGFRKDTPSSYDYEPQRINDRQTVKYNIRIMAMADDHDSTLLYRDTTRVTTTVDENGRMTNELIERFGNFTGSSRLVEYAYSYVQDTVVTRLVRFTPNKVDVGNGMSIGTNAYELTKKYTKSDPENIHIHRYELLLGPDGRKSEHTFDDYWVTEKKQIVFVSEDVSDVIYSSSGSPHHNVNRKTFTLRKVVRKQS